MASHYGRDATYDKIRERFFWYGMYESVRDYIKGCIGCQKQGDLKPNSKLELKNVPIPNEVMKQVGVDLCNLPHVDGFQHLMVVIDYFSK